MWVIIKTNHTGGERNGMGTNVSVWSSFGMVLSAKAGSFCSSSRNTSRG